MPVYNPMYPAMGSVYSPSGNYPTNSNNAWPTYGPQAPAVNPAGQPASGFDPNKSFDLGLNTGTLQLGSNVLSGIGNIASGWAAMKQLNLAQDAFDFNKQQAQQNYGAMRTTVNNRIADQNAWKTAQGRTDLSSTV